MSVPARQIGTVLGIVAWCSAAAWAEPILWPANGHYYDVVHMAVTWDQAQAAASSLSWLGVAGHLATVTSADENLFLTNTFGATALHLHWLGGYQPPGSPEPAGGWKWVTGEPFTFLGWSPGEPNNAGGNEDRICFDHSVQAWGKPWNDLRGSRVVSGYVVEFPVPEPSAGLLFALPVLMARRRH